MTTQRQYEVEQIKGRVAVLLDGDRHQIAVPLMRLPKNIKQGVSLSVPVDDTGTPDWAGAIVETAAGRGSEATGNEPHQTHPPDSEPSPAG